MAVNGKWAICNAEMSVGFLDRTRFKVAKNLLKLWQRATNTQWWECREKLKPVVANHNRKHDWWKKHTAPNFIEILWGKMSPSPKIPINKGEMEKSRKLHMVT